MHEVTARHRIKLADQENGTSPFGTSSETRAQKKAAREKQEKIADEIATDNCQTYLSQRDGHKPTNPILDTSDLRLFYFLFAKNRIGVPAQLPFLERRQVPPNFEQPPACYFVTDGFEGDEAQSHYNVIPYLPHQSYWDQENLPEWEPATDLDGLVYELFSGGIISQVEYTASQISKQRIGKEAIFKQPKKYAGWAESTTVAGVDWQRSLKHQERISQVMTRGSVHADGHRVVGQGEDRFYLQLDYELESELTTLDDEIKNVLIRIDASQNPDRIRKVNDPEPADCATEAERLLNVSLNILDLCRWHIDHQTNMPNVTSLLERAYAQICTLNQLANHPQHATQTQIEFFSDITNLISGYDSNEATPTGERMVLTGQADYLDAFFMVSNSLTVSLTLKNNPNLRGNRYGYKSYFSDAEKSQYKPEQTLILMSVLYLRMPTWQRETYQHAIRHAFTTILQILPDTDEASLLDNSHLAIPFVGSKKAVAFEDVDDRTMAKLGGNLHVILADVLAHPEDIPHYDHMRLKTDGRLEAIVKPGDSAIGFGSGDVFVDEEGFVQTVHADKKQKTTLKEFLATVANEGSSVLERIAQVPGMLAESRLGRAMADKIEEMLQRSLDVGSVAAVGAVAGLMEKLLGKKLDAADTNFINLIQQLGLINAEIVQSWEANEDELREMLLRCKKGDTSITNLDEIGLLITLFATTGEVPRSLLVEQASKGYENLATITTIQTIIALHDLDTKKGWKLFGKKEKSVNKVLAAKTDLARYLQEKRQEQGEAYDPQTDPAFRDKAELAIASVTKLLHHNRSYEKSMSSPLAALTELQKSGRLLARCSVDGQMLTAILKFISPDIIVYMASTYGEEALLSHEEWLTHHLPTAEESGNHSHNFSQSDWQSETEHPDIFVADATGGFTYSVSGADCQIDTVRSAVMERGRASTQGVAQRNLKQSVIAHCIDSGSTLISSFASDAGQLEYALEADPDNPVTLLWRIADTTSDLSARLDALDKLLILEPHSLAMTTTGDYQLAGTISRLDEVINLGLRHHRLGAAMFASQILRTAHFIPQAVREMGNTAYRLVVRSFAHLPQAEFEEAITQASPLLIPTDVETITQERTIWLTELTQQLAANTKSTAQKLQLEATIRAGAAVELENSQHQNKAALAEITTTISQIEAENKASNPTAGHLSVDQLHAEIRQRSNTLSALNSDGNSGGALGNHFESLTAENSQGALLALITRADGNRLTGEALTKQLQNITLGITKAALELGYTKLRRQLGERLSASLETEKGQQMLLTSSEPYAVALCAGFAKTAETLQIPLEAYSFPEAVEQLSQMKNSQLAANIQPLLTG